MMNQETLEPPSDQEYDDFECPCNVCTSQDTADEKYGREILIEMGELPEDYPGDEPQFTVEVPIDAKPLTAWYVERKYSKGTNHWTRLHASMYLNKEAAYRRLAMQIPSANIEHRILEVTYMPIREEVIG
jgi:hypothetical protein